MAARLDARERDVILARQQMQETIRQRTASLRDANTRLAEIDASRRRFFADISHELRTSLTVIKGEAEFNLNERAAPDKDAMKTSFGTILDRVRGLRRRVDDMLRVARSESGRLDLHTEPIDLVALVRTIGDEEAASVTRKSVTLAIDTVGEAAMVKGDREWLRQVVAGLIENASKHAPSRSAITIGIRVAEGKARLTVRDEGFGVGLALARWVSFGRQS